MKLQARPPLHLTYCLNIHPGETWAENLDAIRKCATKVRDRVTSLYTAPTAPRLAADGTSAPCDHSAPFGLGLRLSATAASELHGVSALADFRQFLRDENLYVFTINGFPYGQFHDAVVKENVYAPDWQDPRRRDYTIQLADILAALLPKGVPGSISTVPCTYKAWLSKGGMAAAVCRHENLSVAGVSPASCRSDMAPAVCCHENSKQLRTMVQMLADVAAHLADLRSRNGRDICLALEPEPDCYLETTAETIEFFKGPLLEHGVAHLVQKGLSTQDASDAIARHLGVCVDTAHSAVEFEDLAGSIRQLQAAGIRIGKVQLSAALQLSPTQQALERLGDFYDRVYLHQVKAMTADRRIRSVPDLPDALVGQASRLPLPAAREASSSDNQWRVHFHVPLFCDRIEPLASTASLMTAEFWELLRAGATANVEIETYTFNVLPKELQSADVTQSIALEYEWVLSHLEEPRNHGGTV